MDISVKFSIIISVLYCFHITKIHGQTVVLGTLNGNVTLICPIRHSSTDGKTLIWAGPPYTGESGSTYFTTDDGVNTDTALGSRLSIVGNNTAGEYNMMISILQESDEGKYRCVYGTNNVEYFLRLKVMLSAVTLKPNYFQIKEGSKCDFVCRTSDSAPAANITWYKVRQGSLIPIKLTGDISISYEGKATISTLTYTGQKQDNNGTVYCNASQESTHIKSQTLHISVLYKPALTLFPSFNPLMLYEGQQNVQLTCNSTDANPLNVTFRWSYKNRNESNNVYNIVPVTKTSGGNYTCFGWNIAGKSSSTISVVIQYGPSIDPIIPKIFIVGRYARVSCNVTSFPAAEITWTGPNNLQQTGNMLIFNKTSKSYNGTYKCRATNTLTPSGLREIHNQEEINVTIDILYKPKVLNISSPSIVEGENLNLTCSSHANPPTHIYQWKKIGDDFYQQNRTLVIPNIRRTHSGKYQCMAMNTMSPTDGRTENGKGYNEVVLNVKYPPKIESLGLIGSQMEITEDDEISLICKINSYPKSNVTWISNTGNNRLKHVEYMTTISFYNITTTCLDTGTYTCTALNGIGDSISNETMLFVRCSPRIDNRLQQTMHNKISVKTGHRLHISARYLAYPIAKVTWVFSQQNLTDNRNKTLNDSDNGVHICNENNIYWQTTELTKSFMTEDDFGIYTVTFQNELSSASSEFYVEPEQAPDAPSPIMSECLDDSTVNITWKPGFSAVSEQRFRIQYRKSDEYLFRNWTKEIPDANTSISEILYGLQYGIKYYFRVVAVNNKGETPSNEESCRIVVLSVIGEQSQEMHIVGASLGSLTVLSAIIVVILYLGRKKHLQAKKKNDEFLMNRKSRSSQRYSCDDEDGMKDNILYEPAGPNYKPKSVKDGTNDIYAVVKKTNRRSQTVCDIYAEVKKTKKKDFKKGKDQALGIEGTADFLPGPSGECFSETSSKLPKRNKDGLLYADLVLQEEKTDGNKCVIRGIEDRTVYVEVDFSRRTFPLPADDDKNPEK